MTRPTAGWTFGPAVESDGRVRFRLWAPGQSAVRLAIEGAGEVAMQRSPDGWFEHLAIAPPGTLYRFLLDDGLAVPDPAARAMPAGIKGASVVVDPAYGWRHADWKGRPWRETVLYELHVGTFSPEGTYAGVAARLPALRDLGVTAVELMPIGQFAGERGWGYDGVLPYAPHHAYGTPDELKALVDAAHGLGMMMFLDVVYNHFGPEGNYLPLYCPTFFRADRPTPWGAAIDYRQPLVRAFAIENALYWLDEFRFDGLRLDAVHAIVDEGPCHLLDELATGVRQRLPDREVHLVLENEHNEARRLVRTADGRPGHYDAQWNDDWHHCAHVLATGESEAYYRAFVERPAALFARALATGFVYQGEPSPIHDGKPRGEPSGGLPPTAFVSFLQNHDQVGNRALGHRLSVLAAPQAVETLTAILLLGPQVPMLFMGEEWGCERPFLFFCDFEGELAEAVRNGRRAEFRHFQAFADPAVRAQIPDPVDRMTFEQSTLDWTEPEQPTGRSRRQLVHRLLDIRARSVVPVLRESGTAPARAELIAEHGLAVGWQLGDGAGLHLLANLGPEELAGVTKPRGAVLFAWPDEASVALVDGRLPPWSCVFHLEPGQEPA